MVNKGSGFREKFLTINKTFKNWKLNKKYWKMQLCHISHSPWQIWWVKWDSKALEIFSIYKQNGINFIRLNFESIRILYKRRRQVNHLFPAGIYAEKFFYGMSKPETGGPSAVISEGFIGWAGLPKIGGSILEGPNFYYWAKSCKLD